MPLRTVRARKIDPKFIKEVKEAAGDNILACYQCGTCVGACPAGTTTPYRVRKVIAKALMGFKEEVLSSPDIWRCTTCFMCQERCPRGVRPTDVMIALRNIAARNGYLPEVFKNSFTNLLAIGNMVPLNPETMELRKELGLQAEPPSAEKSQRDLKEIREIIKATGIKEKLGVK